MTADSLPSNPEDHDDGSLFDDFINHSLDLGGLDEDEADDEELELDDLGGIFGIRRPNNPFSPFSRPSGGVRGVLPPSSGSRGPRLPRIPMRDDVRWRHAVMLLEQPTLELHQPFFDYRDHNGQLILPLARKSRRRITYIRNIMPGWTAVRYKPAGGTVGEFSEKMGGKVIQHHHLNMANKEIAGFVKTEELPALRAVWVSPADFEWALIVVETVLITAAIALVVTYLSLRIYVGNPPATGGLVDRIATLEAQVQALELQQGGAELPAIP